MSEEINLHIITMGMIVLVITYGTMSMIIAVRVVVTMMV
jgi:hypothetical protein